jgi:hypothetical protein
MPVQWSKQKTTMSTIIFKLVAVVAVMPMMAFNDDPQPKLNTLDTCAVFAIPFYQDTTALFPKLEQLGLTRTAWKSTDTAEGNVSYRWLDSTYVYSFAFHNGQYVGADVTYYSPYIIKRMNWFRKHAATYALQIDGTSDAQIKIYPCSDGIDRAIGVFFVRDGGVLFSVMVDDPVDRNKD